MAAIMKDNSHKNGIEIASSLKKNLRRNIEKTFGNDIKFINVKYNVLLYPQSMTVETAILKPRQKIRRRKDDLKSFFNHSKRG